MIRVIPSNKLLVIYLVLSGLTYIGLLTNNAFSTYFGLMLFIVFTSYVLSWYLLAMLVALYSRLIPDQGRAELTVGSSVIIGARILSKIPIRWDAKLTLIHSPHIQSNVLRVRINNEFPIKLMGRWIGSAKVIGGIMELSDSLGLLSIQRLLLCDCVEVVIRPERSNSTINRVGVGGYTEHGLSMEGRLGDFRSLLTYDYERPASSIHWLTSARVSELMMINRSDYGSCPIFIVNASSRTLVPQDGKRPIDEALQLINDLSNYCGEVKVILMRRGYVEEKIVSRGAIPYLEREIRVGIIRSLAKMVYMWVCRVIFVSI
ncbi:DUF58 domain-containing protein [Vulcanisaeta sp. JCM 16161]|uniref:DUF58 domain-containing protein n=1 Tax=Vulcanisaeta sp. JCM 16161 TaxID=1295372 RepID=UPI000B0E6BA7|nr:DUF58 domain-containing protein [Vulcanisaeta sp. JCM 16161]